MAEKEIMKPEPRKKRKDAMVRLDKYGRVIQRDKMDLFLEEYVANGGNATRAAMKIFDTGSYRSAQVLGSLYLKKAKDVGRFILEEKGGGLPKLIDHALEKMEDSEGTEWWDRLMKFGGYADFMGKSGPAQPQVVNIVQTEKQVLSKYIDAEVLDQIDAELSRDDEEPDEEEESPEEVPQQKK